METGQKLEDFSKIIRWKIKQTTASGHKFSNWPPENLGKFDLLQRWRRARAAKSAAIFSTSESRELWRSSYFVKTRLDYSNIMANYHTWTTYVAEGPAGLKKVDNASKDAVVPHLFIFIFDNQNEN